MQTLAPSLAYKSMLPKAQVLHMRELVTTEILTSVKFYKLTIRLVEPKFEHAKPTQVYLAAKFKEIYSHVYQHR
jgi:hypothetical protein